MAGAFIRGTCLWNVGAFTGLLETFRRDLGIGGPCSSNPLVRGLSADCGVTPQKVVRTNPAHQKSETTSPDVDHIPASRSELVDLHLGGQ